MADTPAKLKPKCLCIDIETDRKDTLILREIGAFRPDTDARVRLAGRAPDLTVQLDAITAGAAFVLGHNVVAFDQPALATLHSSLALHALPLVDTLELSPVAFPQNPYHRLVKDYKLCTVTRNDPVRDAELAYELFLDQRESLKKRVEEYPDEALCLHFLLAQQEGKGIDLFATLRHAFRPSLAEAQAAWLRATAGKVCATAQQRVIDSYLPDSDWHKPLAYTLAWLGVAGGNSVLPPWVSLAFPATREVIALLRDTPCANQNCIWCHEQHDLSQLLPRYFPGIQDFRQKPCTPEGKSLQRAVVENGFAGKSTLAILPTGGGKSLCYQLPALARYYRNGSLTVVISPLQSLMKDQVDNLEGRGITCAGYLNGLLNPLERRAMLDKLRLGDLGLIFVAPEQFRSSAFAKAIMHREIGAWVFDEAHCLSKWGHDFRPDYLYVARFIKARQKDKPSPVFCFTATAKQDVVEDICKQFDKHLGITLDILNGGAERENLHYEVRQVPASAKYAEVLRLLQESLREDGVAIVFCARRKAVEELANFLRQAELDCRHFHGGMEPAVKRDVQEAFIKGELRVIAATNAFGMGVDKADVRLVIHLDTPGSLENYLQEAGRAGRDQAAARCILLYDDADLDIQFRMLRDSRLTQHDIRSILKALRTIDRRDKGEGDVVVTSGEILLEIPETHRLDPDAADTDTKVRIAIAWLEEARLLERHENHTRVFPGSLLVADLDEAREILVKKLERGADPAPYLAILSILMQARDDEGISTDELMLTTGQDARRLQALLRELDRWKLLSNDVEIGVTLYREPDTAERLKALRLLEEKLLDVLRQEAPDADQDDWQILNVRRLCDSLRRETGMNDFDPEKLSRLLKSFTESFGGDGGHKGLFSLRPAGPDNRYIKLQYSWQKIDTIRQRRMQFAEALLTWLLQRRQGNNLLVTCKQGELEAALQADTTLQELDIKNWDAALAAALLYLDANEVWHLTRGKAVFRSAMNIALNADERRRQFKKSDYAELALHYQDKIIQVHVIAEFARLSIGKVQAAVSFITDYFKLHRDQFIRRYFAGRKDVLEMATTEASHKKILTGLQNPAQQAIVAAPVEDNLLVLAGPGAGKTRVIVHRVAWLLRESMVPPEEIMVLTYNRSAAVEIRKRLRELVGIDAVGITVQTLHALALRITGTSYAVAVERGESIEFGAVIQHATSSLREAAQGDEAGASIRRDRLLSGLRHLLVDEYQDIDGDHYALISALAGRSLKHDEDKVSLFAVGDDDQNIYAFRGADVRFIRQFEADYQARRHHLVENYRSTRHIIDCANSVIVPARERMKTDHAIRIDHARRDFPEGGSFTQRDPLTQGRVHILTTPADRFGEITMALTELRRLNALIHGEKSIGWGAFAVIARHWEGLEIMAALCREQNIPIRLLRDKHVPDLHKTREGNQLLTLLRGTYRKSPRKRVLLRGNALMRWFRLRYRVAADDPIAHPQRAALAQFILSCESTLAGAEHVIPDLIEALYEFGTGEQISGGDSPHAPMTLLSAHGAKGLEFDHVLILDGQGWQNAGDEERRLFYVAMTRARQTLTLCEQMGGKHAFIRACEPLALRSRPEAKAVASQMTLASTWYADLEHVVLSWAGTFTENAKVHDVISRLDYGSVLTLRSRKDDIERWELVDESGVIIARMAKKFTPPQGEILSVSVSAILVRHREQENNQARIHCANWELILPEIRYLPERN